MSRFQYPRLFLLLGCFAGTFALAKLGVFEPLHDWLNDMGYVSAFLGGVLFSYGFTTPIAIVILSQISGGVMILPAAMLGGLGALLADMTIFSLVRYSVLHDEISHLRMSVFGRRIKALLYHDMFSDRIRTTLLWSIAGFVIASPLPDELGVLLVNSISDVETKRFTALCYTLNTIGIILIMLAAR